MELQCKEDMSIVGYDDNDDGGGNNVPSSSSFFILLLQFFTESTVFHPKKKSDCDFFFFFPASLDSLCLYLLTYHSCWAGCVWFLKYWSNVMYY